MNLPTGTELQRVCHLRLLGGRPGNTWDGILLRKLVTSKLGQSFLDTCILHSWNTAMTTAKNQICRYCPNIGQVMSKYRLISNNQMFSKHSWNIDQILLKCWNNVKNCVNIDNILSKYCLSIIQIFSKYFTNFFYQYFTSVSRPFHEGNNASYWLNSSHPSVGCLANQRQVCPSWKWRETEKDMSLLSNAVPMQYSSPTWDSNCVWNLAQLQLACWATKWLSYLGGHKFSLPVFCHI